MDEFGGKFRDSTPEPGDDYWQKIEDSLTKAEKSSAEWDKSMVVGGLKDMNEKVEQNDTRLPATGSRKNFVIAAAVLGALLIGAAAFLAARGDESIDVADTSQLDREDDDLTGETQQDDESVTGDFLLTGDGRKCFIRDDESGEQGFIDIQLRDDEITGIENIYQASVEEPGNVYGFDADGLLTPDNPRVRMSGTFMGEGDIEVTVQEFEWLVTDENITTSVGRERQYVASDCEDVDQILEEQESISDEATDGVEQIGFAPGRYCYLWTESNSERSGELEVDVAPGNSVAVQESVIDGGTYQSLFDGLGSFILEDPSPEESLFVLRVDGVQKLGLEEINSEDAGTTKTYDLQVVGESLTFDDGNFDRDYVMTNCEEFDLAR